MVNTLTPGDQFGSRLARGASGDFVVAWEGSGGARARGFDPTGDGVSADFFFGQQSPAISVLEDQNYLLVWSGAGLYDEYGIHGRIYDLAGIPHGSELVVNDLLDGYAAFPHVSAASNGNVFVVWYRPGTDGSEIVARRFCDTGVPSCDRCVGFDDAIDTDVDGIADGCDTCKNVAGARDFTKIRLRVSRNDASPTALRVRRITLKGDFRLTGAGSTFSDLNPLTDGLVLRIENSTGARVYETTVPPGAFDGSIGWQNAGGTRWSFVGEPDAAQLQGIRRISITDKSTSAPGRVDMSVDARQGTWAVDPRYLPLRARVTFGDSDAAAAGLCAELAFATEECRFNANGQMSCKR